MTDDLEQGPDLEDYRRHIKRLYSEAEYRLRYCRLDHYRPNRKQLAYHNLIADEKLLRAGNQEGKTHCLGAEMAMHATQLYPIWSGLGGWLGRKFLVPPKIERAYEFVGWAASTTSKATREGIQTKLFGDISQSDGWGTGLIPLDNLIGRPIMERGGIGLFIDTAIIAREGGGRAVIRQKTGEQKQRAFAGESVDVLWVDEDLGEGEGGAIYGEAQARTIATNGMIMVSMTPSYGVTPIRRRFKEKMPGTAEVLMTLDDALVSNGGHIPDEDVPKLMRKFKASEIQTKLFGADMQGEGAVFETPIEQIKRTIDWQDFPPHYKWLWALDFRHSGNASGGHPFAAVLVAWSGPDDGDVIHVVEAFKMHGLPPMHVARIKGHRYWRAPVTYPHDGGRGASLLDGDTVAQVYRKPPLQLNMLPQHAQFAAGGINFEAGITEMENRLATGRLVVASQLTQFFDEYQGYHRKEGQVYKVDDDILSACRYACMDIRHAKTPERFEGFGANPLSRDPRTRFAKGSMNHPDGGYDLFRV